MLYVKLFKKLPNFSKEVVSFYISLVVCESSVSSMSSITLATINLFKFSHSNRYLIESDFSINIICS